MKPLLLILVVAILAGFFYGMACELVKPAEAFTPPNVRHHPATSTSTPIIDKLAKTGVFTWQAIDQYGWMEWRDIIHAALDTDSPDPNSLGRVYNRFLEQEHRGQIEIREARPGEMPDQLHYATTAAFMEAKCGAAWATACDFLTNPLPVPAYYKAANLLLWGYNARVHVPRHETNHSIARACDQYEGGCPRTSDGRWAPQVRCLGNPDTLMDCGGAAVTATAFDYETFKTAYPPDTFWLQQVQCSDEGWDPCDEQWKWGLDAWSPQPAPYGTWFYNGVVLWDACDPSWNGRHSPLGFWVHAGTPVFFEEVGVWRSAPPC